MLDIASWGSIKARRSTLERVETFTTESLLTDNVAKSVVDHRYSHCLWMILVILMVFLGTSSGFGRRLVTVVLNRGDRVIASARSVESIKDFPSNPNLHLLQLDITAGTEIIQARIDAAVGVWGRIDVVVNNAGEGLPGFLEEGG